MHVNLERLLSDLETLASFTDGTPPGISRLVFAEADQKARTWLKAQCRGAGLAVREDAVGNMFARWTGAQPQLPAIGTGSHIDAIPHSGKFDGTVGVLGGLEAIRSLQQSGFAPRRSIELLLFTAEEPTRFGLGCLGSRLLSGGLDETADTHLQDGEGRPLSQLRASAGFKGSLNEVRLQDGYYAGFVELHIEQGPLLEDEGLAVGVVTSIAAPAALRITVEGEGGHAGGVLMPDRKDAFCAAAEIVLAVEQRALATGAIDTCGTVGKCHIYPGAVNSIPSRVEMEVDIRDTDEQRRNRVLREIEQACEQVATARKVKVRVEPINADAPAACSPRIIEAAVQAATENGLSYKKMVSRATTTPCSWPGSHRSVWYSSRAGPGSVIVPTNIPHRNKSRTASRCWLPRWPACLPGTTSGWVEAAGPSAALRSG